MSNMQILGAEIMRCHIFAYNVKINYDSFNVYIKHKGRH